MGTHTIRQLLQADWHQRELRLLLAAAPGPALQAAAAAHSISHRVIRTHEPSIWSETDHFEPNEDEPEPLSFELDDAFRSIWTAPSRLSSALAVQSVSRKRGWMSHEAGEAAALVYRFGKHPICLSIARWLILERASRLGAREVLESNPEALQQALRKTALKRAVDSFDLSAPSDRWRGLSHASGALVLVSGSEELFRSCESMFRWFFELADIPIASVLPAALARFSADRPSFATHGSALKRVGRWLEFRLGIQCADTCSLGIATMGFVALATISERDEIPHFHRLAWLARALNCAFRLQRRSELVARKYERTSAQDFPAHSLQLFQSGTCLEGTWSW